MDYTPKEKETPGYKRVHFFKYFLTETDWNDRHQYHLAKLRLHTSQLHGMGIQDGLTTFRVLQSLTMRPFQTRFRFGSVRRRT